MADELVTSCCGRSISDCPGCPENTILLTREEYMNNIDSIAKRIGLNWSEEEFSKAQFEKGIAVEMQEHHDDPETKVVESKEEAAKVAWAHLKEDPKYYDKLEQIEESSQLSLVLSKIDNNSIAIDDFNKLIQEATPASVIDRVRRKMNPNNAKNRRSHDNNGHSKGLPKLAARINPSRKRSNNTQMQHGGRQGHRRSVRTQRRNRNKLSEAIQFFEKNIGTDIKLESIGNIDRELYRKIAVKLMTMPNINRDWLSNFVNRITNVRH